jgi:type I restriction enzyme R subunit
MLFYAGSIIEHPTMENPTLVFLTDRNDLDDQLFGQFQRCHEIVRQTPVQAESVEHLRKLLNVASGGVIFTTLQKFAPEKESGKAPLLSKRRNIVVIADEAHRSQYDLIDGLARNLRDSLPNASFIGFTGTPIEKTDANTRAVFGDYISIYDIQRAVADKATVPIYYESRVAYDALAANNSALEVMGKDNLKVIATELVTQVRKSVTIDWTLRESARAKIKVLVKRILRRHGYPPDLQDEATKLVLQQAELLCAEWAA